jgi:hypothetical protein
MDLTVYQILSVLFCVAVVFSISYYAGYITRSKKYKERLACDREEMLTIERALKGFWDNEKQKLENEKKDLAQRIQLLESKLEQYRRKAAGVGIMGLRKNKLSDMLITLLIENESLEEKLFLQNLKLKQERDEFLENELRSISYKRILLSELLTQTEVRREMEKVISDRSRLKRLDLKQKDPGTLDYAPADDDEDEEKTALS